MLQLFDQLQIQLQIELCAWCLSLAVYTARQKGSQNQAEDHSPSKLRTYQPTQPLLSFFHSRSTRNISCVFRAERIALRKGAIPEGLCLSFVEKMAPSHASERFLNGA